MKEEYDICWDVEAGKQLKKIYKYIKKNQSESYAKKLRSAIMNKVQELRTQPEKFPPEPLLSHRNENFRFIIIKPYKVVYEFTNKEVQILFIYSTRQNPQILSDHFE